jgi:hypothetical protein
MLAIRQDSPPGKPPFITSNSLPSFCLKILRIKKYCIGKNKILRNGWDALLKIEGKKNNAFLDITQLNGIL